MRVAVLGSGVIGVSTAYHLARLGHEVTVLDRQPAAALETSFANAGQLSTGYSAPWAAPGIPLKALKWMLSRHSPLVIRPSTDPRLWLFLARLFANCNAASYAVNKARMVRVAAYSRDALAALREETGISYDDRARGTLQLFRSEKQMAGAHKDIAVLESYGIPYELLDVDGVVAAEPALAAVRHKLVGGLRLPEDETGDCFLFTQRLAERAQTLGVQFRHGTAVQRVSTGLAGVNGVDTDRGHVPAEAVVVALGSYSQSLVAPFGIQLPVYPVKGYSITVPVVDESAAPVSTVMDETYKVAVTRLGHRIRAAGTAELAGFDLTLRQSRRATVEHVVRDLFGAGGDLSRAQFWTGLRPMTPDGTPILGHTGVPGLFLNTGHGTLGWTMAAGSGRLLADLVSGRAAEIDTAGLGLDRYGHGIGRLPSMPVPGEPLGASR